MNDLPLHPALVHLPIGIGLLAPLLAAFALSRLWRPATFRNATWGLVLITQLVALGGGFLALKTGEIDEEVVERVVRESAIHDHEEGAELFVGIAAAALLAGMAAFALRGVAGQAAAGAAVALSMAAAGQVLVVGHSGGALVYQQGAAAAHVAAAGGAGGGGAAGAAAGDTATRRGGDDDDD